MHPDINDEKIIIGPWWFNYTNYSEREFIIYDIKKQEELKRVKGHLRYPAYAMWTD